MQHNKSRHFEDAQLLRQQFGQHSSGTFDGALSAQDICAVVERQPKPHAIDGTHRSRL